MSSTKFGWHRAKIGQIVGSFSSAMITTPTSVALFLALDRYTAAELFDAPHPSPSLFGILPHFTDRPTQECAATREAGAIALVSARVYRTQVIRDADQGSALPAAGYDSACQAADGCWRVVLRSWLQVTHIEPFAYRVAGEWLYNHAPDQ